MSSPDNERVTRNGYTNFPNALFDNGLAGRIGTSAFAVYLHLITWKGNDSDVSYPSQGRIAKELGICEKTVINAIAKLLEHNLIEIIEKGVGRSNNNKYRLIGFNGKGVRCSPFTTQNVQDLHPLPEERVQDLHPLPEEKVQDVPVKGVRCSKEKVQDLHPTINNVQLPGTTLVGTPDQTSGTPPENTPDDRRVRNYKYTDQDVAIVDTLEQYIRDSYKASWRLSAPKEAHYNEMRLLRENGNANIDGPISIDRIRDVMRFLRHDTFWLPKGNIRSVSKLREKFDVFEMKVANTKDTPKDDGHTPLRLEDL